MSQHTPEIYTSTVAEVDPLSNKCLPGEEVNFGINPFSSPQNQNLPLNNNTFREHKYTPNTSSPLAHSEASYEDPIYSGEPVPAELVNNVSSHKIRSHSEGAIDIQEDLVDTRKDRRKTLSGSQRKHSRNFIDEIDQLDLSDIYGGTTYHHESPYDCILPHRNVTGQSPVLAFQQNEEKNFPSSDLPSQHSGSFDDQYSEEAEEWKPRSSHRYTAYDHTSFNYKDSFLEGSTAYGVTANEIDDDSSPKRLSLLRLGVKKKNKDKDRNITPLDEEEEEEEDNEDARQSRIRTSKSRSSFAVFFPKKYSRDLSKKPLYPSSSQQESYLQQNSSSIPQDEVQQHREQFEKEKFQEQQQHQHSQSQTQPNIQREHQRYQPREQEQLLQNAKNQESPDDAAREELPQPFSLNQQDPPQLGQSFTKNQISISEAKNTSSTPSLHTRDQIAPLPNISKLTNRKTGARTSWMQKLANLGR